MQAGTRRASAAASFQASARLLLLFFMRKLAALCFALLHQGRLFDAPRAASLLFPHMTTLNIRSH